MDINTYASYDEIRAALGVSSLELKDDQLSLDIYGDFLYQELASVSGILTPDTISRNLAGQYTYLASLAVLTDNQTLLMSYIRSLAIYTVAANVVDSISLLVPKTISDGKALLTRFSSERTFESVREDINSRKYDLKRKIKDLLGVTVTEKVFVGVVAPLIDVVTNAEYE